MKTAFFDIEATGLKADFGTMLSSCILDADAPRTMKSVKGILWNPKKHGLTDKLVIDKTVKLLKPYDLIVTWYGTWYDIPFLRTRCLMENIPFIDARVFHIDLWQTARKKLCFSRNSLDNASEVMRTKFKKSDIEKRTWALAGKGHKPSLEYVFHHNIKDVLVLANVYQKMVREVITIPKVK